MNVGTADEISTKSIILPIIMVLCIKFINSGLFQLFGFFEILLSIEEF